MRLVFSALAFAALLAPSVAAAQVPTSMPSSTDERRLTPEQIEAVLAEVAAKRKAADRPVPDEMLADEEAEQIALPPVHGQAGFSIGTGGYREVFGSAIYPLGQDSVAAIHLNFVDLGRHRFPR